MSAQYTLPQRMLDAAICAYSVKSGEPFQPLPLYLDPLDLDGPVVPFNGGKHDIDAGFVGKTRTDPDGQRWVILSFRGTLGSWQRGNFDSFLAFLDDWLQDGDSRPVPMVIKGEQIGKVEEGFASALQCVWPLIQAQLDDVDWTSFAGIQITGHSKGAAMTFLAAAMVRRYYPQAASIHVHAFAAPLAGDADFASWYGKENLSVSTTRYQRVNDIVPFLPPSEVWNLFHHLPWTFHPEGIAIEAALKLLSLQLYGGYVEVGSLHGLVTENPKNSTMIHGAAEFLQKAIQHAIYLGNGGGIASAHSAIDSYWPALFPET